MSESTQMWAPVILCTSCAQDGVRREAEYILPQTGGTVGIVCDGHASDWFDEDSNHLIPAARRLHELTDGDRAHVADNGDAADQE